MSKEITLFDRKHKIKKEIEQAKYIGPECKATNTGRPYNMDRELNTNDIVYDFKVLEHMVTYRPEKEENYHIICINPNFFKSV